MSIEKPIPIKAVERHLSLNEAELYDSFTEFIMEKEFYDYYYPTGDIELDKYLEKQFKNDEKKKEEKT